MEVKEGYKNTEVGVIPENWDVKSIGDLGVFSKGQGVRKDEAKSGNLPCVRYGELYTLHNDYIKGFGSFISKEVAKTSKRLKKGDILFAGSGETKEEIGKCAAFIDDIEAYVGGDVVILSPKNGDSQFYGYLFNSPVVAKQKAQKGQGDAVVHITATGLSDIMVPYPSEPEQKAIAKALSDIDSLIISLTKLTEKKKSIKQGAMRELLTGKKRLEGFNGDWIKVNIGSIGKLTGSGVDKKIIEGQKPVTLLNYLDVYHRVFIYRKYLKHTVTATDEQRNKCLVLKGDIFFTPTSETPDDIAKSAVAMEDMNDVVYSYHVLRLRPYDGFNNLFLNYAFMTQEFINQTTTFSEGSGTRYIITLKKFKDLTITIPQSKEEQTAISDILSDMDTEIEKLENKLYKYRSIKQGMMQELLTGRIRLIEEGIQ